jgi:acetyl esterase/lipase
MRVPLLLALALTLVAAPTAQAVVLPQVPADVPPLSAGPGSDGYCTTEGALRNCTRWYSAGNGTKLLVDVWRPGATTANSDLPTVVIFHGGGYHSGWRGTNFGESNAKFLARQGFVALTVDYRLGPCEGDPTGRSCVSPACRAAGLAHPCVDYTQKVDEFDREGSLDDLQGDVANAVKSARDHARLYGGDLKGKVGTWGTSAGAGLALWADYRGMVLGSRANVGVAYAGALVFDPAVYARYGQDLENPTTSPGTVLQMIGCPRDDEKPGETYDGCDGKPGLAELECPPQLYPKGSPCAERYRRASVSSAIDKSDPPGRAVQARNDVQVASRNTWMFWREMDRLGLVKKTHFERWIWENDVSCVGGGVPGIGCAVGNNSRTPGQDDCGSTHTAFEGCVYDDDNEDGHGQAIDRGGIGGQDNITLPAAYDDKSEGLITTCFLLRYLDHVRWRARADCPR